MKPDPPTTVCAGSAVTWVGLMNPTIVAVCPVENTIVYVSICAVKLDDVAVTIFAT